MATLVPAAEQFIKEVQTVDEDVTARRDGEVDGIDFYRSVRFHGASDWLGDVLRSMWNEPRLSDWHEEDGDIVLTFVASTKADFAHPFGVVEAAKVIRAPEEEPASKPAKKAAARKKTVSPDN